MPVHKHWRLNPFMNQVYLYALDAAPKTERAACLNPFMNQVYLYNDEAKYFARAFRAVLIPL